ncbi:zinc finger protein [Anopheles darlingi]|uniref:Zinc finger protein n=1 Tax=Anopheles darlingi TaxID=43151 RepID=W5JVZ2_ANODA|nr:zinc finger protein [Anopheles darlingi]
MRLNIDDVYGPLKKRGSGVNVNLTFATATRTKRRRSRKIFSRTVLVRAGERIFIFGGFSAERSRFSVYCSSEGLDPLFDSIRVEVFGAEAARDVGIVQRRTGERGSVIQEDKRKVMLGKYGDASSSSMMNLESGLRNRVLYHQNMMGMNLMAEFYHHNPTLVNAATVSSSVTGSSSSSSNNSAIAQSQKMLNSLSGTIANAGGNHQQPSQHTNGTPLAISTVSTAATVTSTSSSSSSSSQQPLAQFQCQVCQKTYLTSAMLAVHMKTHDNAAGGFVSRQEATVGSSYLQPSSSSLEHVSAPAVAHGASSKTSPPLLLAQHSIKSEYAGTARGIGQFSSPYGIIKQFDCHICHKSFMTLMNLNLHMKIHENDQKVVAAATAAANVYSSHAGGTGTTYHHQLTHQQQLHPTLLQAASSSGAVPSATATTGRNADGVCQICHKTFNSTEQFTAHMKIHEEEFKNRALYHSSAATGSSTAVATSAAAQTINPFYPTLPQTLAPAASTQPQQQQQLPAVHLYESSKGHRCPICHKMSSNIIEHIKQHEGQLIMGGGGSSATAPGGGSPSVDRACATPGYQLNEETSQASSLAEVSDNEAGDDDQRKQHECLICHKKFSSSSNLAIHIRVHSGEKPFKCSVCGKGFIQSNNLATHMKTHTGEKPYTCTICGKKFSQSNNLKTHIRTHTGERPYACTICGKRFNQKNNLTTHMRTHQLVCMVCGVQFAHPTDLANHMKFHNDEKPYICSVCNKVYLNLDELTEHMKKTHNQVKPYRCHICDKTFTQSNNLKTHIKTHIFQDPYKCQMCSRSFQREDEYGQHMLVHTADKPYECTYCGKRFIQSNNLKTHVRTHTGEKPYSCSICLRNFNQKNNLNTHMRIHTGEKPFECTICDKRFNQSNNLNKHIKTHGQEKDQQQQQQQSQHQHHHHHHQQHQQQQLPS